MSRWTWADCGPQILPSRNRWTPTRAVTATPLCRRAATETTASPARRLLAGVEADLGDAKRKGPKTLVETENATYAEVAASTSETGTTTIAEPDLVDQRQQSDPGEVSGSGTGGANRPIAQQTPVVLARPQLRLMNPDCPVRYIPIHIWPEYLKKLQPRTGRRYFPKRSRTLPKRNGSSPRMPRAGGISVDVVQEYRYTEDEVELPCEDQGLSDTEIVQSGDAESVDSSTTLTTTKRWGWGYALLDAMQNAVPKRCREGEQPHFTFPRKSLSLTPLRFVHHPPGLKRQRSRESTKW
ncbi:hypothetical protein BDM02DRAFT_3131317 [Thelephora ganbajun]|uniref:Uncharacterized protein n=1 Tax=Thelephora ganbajun TaxID=370292 RepID=A0ACB6Z6E4_THEGA|nr:hypothetical protein BDM02DRAFT_3131317 [Thelephora ganbajun]